jgi:branched-chain amino acid aminotransferase
MFLQAYRAAVALNAEFVPPHGFGGGMYVRPQLYGSSPQLGLTATDQTTFYVFVVPTGVHEKAQAMKALIVDDFDCAAPRGIGHVKLGGNYTPVMRWAKQSKAAGYGVTLHLDSARHEDIDEFSTRAFIGARYASGSDNEPGDEVTIVVSDSPYVIESVTCDTVQKIARSFGWTVEKRAVSYKELPNFSEVMCAGTHNE